MRIRFIYPRFKKFLQDHPALREELRDHVVGDYTMPPSLAIPILAALTPPDVEFALTDDNIGDPIDFGEKLDAAVISCFTPQAERAYEIADEYRRRGTTVLMGGIHPTCAPEEALLHADAVCAGEGEPVWLQMLADLRAKTLKRVYRPAEVYNLADLPIPRRDLFRRDVYKWNSHLVLTIRGCPVRCEGCPIPLKEDVGLRFRPVDDVIADIRSMPYREFYVTDDTIMLPGLKSKRYLLKLLERTRDLDVSIFLASTMMMIAEPEFYTELAKGKVSSIYTIFGFDRVSKRLLDPTCTPEEWKYGIDLVRMIEDAGIHFFASFGVGFDYQTPEVVDRILRFSEEAKIDLAEFYILSPFPGTPFGEQAEREGRILHRRYSEWNNANVVFKPKNFTQAELTTAFETLWREFYRNKEPTRTLRSFHVTEEPVMSHQSRVTMTNHDVVIIGGGIAGLAAGSYLQMNGYRTVVLEMGGCCGGVSVSWRRSGYVFDGATNWLPGATPASNLHGMLAELIDFSQLPLSSTDVFVQAENSDAVFTVYKDADRLAREMLRLGPHDGARIRAFTNAIKLASTLAIPYEKSPESMTVIDKLTFAVTNAKLIAFMARWRGTTIHSFASRFESRSLRDLFPQIFPHHEFFSMFGLIMSLGWMHARGEAYPLGGSERFAEVMRLRYEKLGGTVLVNKRVESIDIVSGEARGVRCADGSAYAARHIVSAIDAHATHFGLLQGRYVSAADTRRFSSWRVFPSLVQVSLGVARAFPPDSPKLSCPLSVPLQMGNERAVNMLVRVCSFDPSFAPPGKTAIVVHLRTSDSAYWNDLRTRDRDLYRTEKDRVAQAVIESLDKKFGGIRDAVEAIDVATPATIIRYTGNWQGSYQGWAPTPRSVGALLPSTIKGLRGFYLTGHWLWPGGGLPAVVRVSRQAAQKICAMDRKPFTTRPAGSTPEAAKG